MAEPPRDTRQGHPSPHGAPVTARPVPRVEDATRVVLRPIASPVPLGMLALAVGSLMLTALQLAWFGPSYTHAVASTVLTFVVPLQLLACVFAFLARDVVMATGFGLLTASWASVGVQLLTGPAGGTSKAVGVLAVGAAVALLVPAVAAAPAKPVATVVISVASVRFAITGVYELTGATGWEVASGIIGIVLLATALYGSLALMLEDARHHTILPMQRRTTSADAMSGRFDLQMATLPTEVGVRQES